MEEKDLDVPKVVKQIQQNAYDRENKTRTIPEALISNRERDFKEEPLHKTTYTGQNGTRSEERQKDRNCRQCETPNWNPTLECPARDAKCHNCEKKCRLAKKCRFEQRKRQEIKEQTETAQTEESDTNKSKNLISEIKHSTERTKQFTMTLKIDGTEKGFIIDTGSLVTKIPPGKEITKDKKLLTVTRNYQDFYKNEDIFFRKVTVRAESKRIHAHHRIRKLEAILYELATSIYLDDTTYRKDANTKRPIRTRRNSYTI